MPRQTRKQRADGRYICRCDDRYFLGYTQREVLAAREAYKRDKAEGLKAEARSFHKSTPTRLSGCPSPERTWARKPTTNTLG